MPWLIAMWCINAIAGITLSAMLIHFRHRFSLKRWLRGGNNEKASVSPSVSVVIAARNEEHSVERTLREFAALPGVVEVILVDDDSADNTLRIARTVAADDSRVRVLEAPPLPQGWMGKTHAIHWASQFVATDYILFTDADVHIESLPLQDIVSCMDRDALDHVGGNFRFTLMPGPEVVVGPVFATVAFIALGLVALRCGAGSGAFNLVRKSAYNRINGHSTILGHVADDVALAQRIIKEGLPSRFLDTSPVISVRLFEGLDGLTRSLSRWSVLFSRWTAWLALTLSIFVVTLSCSLVLAPFAPWISQADATSGVGLWGMTTVFMAIGAYLLFATPFVLGSLHSRSRCWGFLSPIGQLMMAGMVAVAAIRFLLGMKVRWRGREYPPSTFSDTSNDLY